MHEYSFASWWMNKIINLNYTQWFETNKLRNVYYYLVDFNFIKIILPKKTLNL
jgi:hypothetical protein